jgi:hypothetical protein
MICWRAPGRRCGFAGHAIQTQPSYSHVNKETTSRSFQRGRLWELKVYMSTIPTPAVSKAVARGASIAKEIGYKTILSLKSKGVPMYYNKHKEIGAIFGTDYSSVSQSRAHLKTNLKASRKLKKQFNRIQEQIDKLSTSKI